jgi:hypothetical protein
MRRWLLAVPFVLSAVDGAHVAALPPAPGPRGARTQLQAAIEAQPVCVGSTKRSAGALGDTLYYRAARLDGGRVAVGYYAFFSEERPWGNNWLTWTFFPALAVDLVYSRALLVAPGLQRALYGAGDVEGVAVIYDIRPNGRLRVDYALAEDEEERTILLSRDQTLAIDPKRPTFYSDVWSHQLGGRSASSRDALAYERCYDADAIRPLPEEVARDFRLEGRARPAHVERLGPLEHLSGRAPRTD